MKELNTNNIIIKVQMSLHSSDGKPRCLIYDKDKKFKYEGAPSSELVEIMGGEPKKYFLASIVGNNFSINEEITKQGW